MKVFRRLFTPKPKPMSLRQKLSGVTQMVASTEEVEIDCDATFDLIDQYAELVARGEDPQHLMPLVHRHLRQCAECAEELQALLAAMKN